MSHSLSTLDGISSEVNRYSSKIPNGCCEESFENCGSLLIDSKKAEKVVASFSSLSLDKSKKLFKMTGCNTLPNGTMAESSVSSSTSPLKAVASFLNVSSEFVDASNQPPMHLSTDDSTEASCSSFALSTSTPEPSLSLSAPEPSASLSAPESLTQSSVVLSTPRSTSRLSLVTASSSYATALSSVDSALSSSDGHLSSKDDAPTPPGEVDKTEIPTDVDGLEAPRDSQPERQTQKNANLCNAGQIQFETNTTQDDSGTLNETTESPQMSHNGPSADINSLSAVAEGVPSPPLQSDAMRDPLCLQGISDQGLMCSPPVHHKSATNLHHSTIPQLAQCPSISTKKASPFGGILNRLKDALPGLSNSSESMRAAQLEKSTTALILQDRQPGLPSKDPSENARHRLMYENIVEEVKKKGKKEAKKNLEKQKNQLKMEELMSSALKVWKRDLLPYWDDVRNNYNTRQLWWHGIPPSIRGVVWKLVVGNDMNITKELYEICLQRFQELLKTMSSSLPSSSSSSTSASPSLSKLAGKNSSSSSLTSSSMTTTAKPAASADCPAVLPPADCRDRDNPVSRESSVELIRLDVSRTFPSLGVFQKVGPYHEYLEGLLGAYVCYRPDVGYVQGMSFVAAILLLNMEAHDAFICFANLLNRPIFIAFFRLNADMMKIYFHTYNFFFKNNMPKLYRHFLEQKLSADLYIIDWVFSLYSKCFNLDIVSRIWDVFFRDGEQFLFRTALGILKLFQPVLLNMDFIQMAQFLVRPPESQVDQAELFQSIESIDMECKGLTFRQILEQFKANQSSAQR